MVLSSFKFSFIDPDAMYYVVVGMMQSMYLVYIPPYLST